MKYILFLILIIQSCSGDSKKAELTTISHQTIYPNEKNSKISIINFESIKEGFENIYELYGIDYINDTLIIDLAYEDYCDSYFYNYRVKGDSIDLLMSAKRYVQLKSDGSIVEINNKSLCNQRVKLKIESVKSKIKTVSINGESVKMK